MRGRSRHTFRLCRDARRAVGIAPPGCARGRYPTIVFHGDRDRTVNSVNGDQVIAQAKSKVTLRTKICRGETPDGMTYTCTIHADENGRPMLEQWILHGAGHAWSGGSAAGSFTEPRGPDASREMLRFFLQRPALNSEIRVVWCTPIAAPIDEYAQTQRHHRFCRTKPAGVWLLPLHSFAQYGPTL